MNKINHTQLLTAHGLSEFINIHIGVKQGCPLNGIEFNKGINPIFYVIQLLRKSIHCLGYADDIVVLEDSKGALEATLQRIVEFMEKLGLQLNAEKCHTVHIVPAKNGCLLHTI